MKFLKTRFFIFIFSIFISIIFLIIFKPILTAKTLYFPYSIHPFDIVKNYPKVWFYIKFIYCFNLIIVNFLTLNSIISFFKINKKCEIANITRINNVEPMNNLKLLVGINSTNNNQVFIPEKGLYQNILITGTIGSRKDKFSYVPIFKTVNKI